MRKLYFFIGLVLTIIGIILVVKSFSRLTGYVVLDEYSNPGTTILGMLLFFAGISLMRNSTNKAQSSMEFLMTYGWAIMAAVIVIGVLSYFGVFSGDLGTNDVALLSPPFYISASSVQKLVSDQGDVLGYRVGIQLSNGGFDASEITSIEIRSKDGALLCSYNPDTPLSMINDQKNDVYLDCENLDGSSLDGDFLVNYIKSGSNLVQTSSGTIKGKIKSFNYSPPAQGAVCGNAIVEQGEVCELLGTNSCTTIEGYSGTQECNGQCNGYDSCVASEYCGDSIINGNEICDGDSLECVLDEKGSLGIQECMPDCSGFYDNCIAQ